MEKVLTKGLKLTGRYLLPFEEVVILIDGKDFDGNDASQNLAGVMLLVEIIPGTKLLKAVPKIAKGVKVWSVVTTVGNKTVNLTYKVVNGLVKFGNKSSFASLIGTKTGEEAHHFIPWASRDLDVVQKAAYAGFHMNSKKNGRAMSKFVKGTGDGIHGPHPAYNKYIEKSFVEFKKKYNNFTPEQAKNFLENELIPKLEGLINDIPDGMNLNDYFKLH